MISIVIMDKSFVAVGYFSEADGWCVVKNAYIVRRWGTTKGLGQLAADGPATNTVLDETPTMRFPIHSLVSTIECNHGVWSKVLEAHK